MKTYSEEEKQNALDLYREVGLAEAWRQTGIPKPTIVTWAKQAGVRTFGTENTREATLAHIAYADQLRAELRVSLLEKTVDLLERMDAEETEFVGKDGNGVVYPIARPESVRHLATSVGILIDKYRLEVGEATSRSESRDLTSALTDDELDAAIREAEEAVRRAASAEGAPSEAEA